MMRAFVLATMVAALALSGSAVYGQQYGDEPPYEEEEYEYDDDDEYEYDEDDRYGHPEVGMFADLRFYGEWRHVHHHGWVWRPFVRVGWRPFFNGHWVWTEFGWMWASYEPFGWATYHYGYWDYDYRLGWIWIPDYDWSPCRVEWVVYDDYVCWAPLAPRGVHFGYPWSRTHFNVWVSVPVYRFTDHNVGRHRVNVKYKSDYSARSAVRSAPEVGYVERYQGRKIRQTPVEMKRAEKEGREVRRVVLPREEERIVERYRVDAPPPKTRTTHRERIVSPPKTRSTEQQRIDAPRKSKESARPTGESKQPAKEKSTKSKSSSEKSSKKSRGGGR
jgi:hypothetical protein